MDIDIDSYSFLTPQWEAATFRNTFLNPTSLDHSLTPGLFPSWVTHFQNPTPIHDEKYTQKPKKGTQKKRVRRDVHIEINTSTRGDLVEK